MAASRPKRQSAGRRFKELVGEEADADELFWNQKAFQESSDDDSGFSSNDVDECTDSAAAAAAVATFPPVPLTA